MLSIPCIFRLGFVFLFCLFQPGLSQTKVFQLRSGYRLLLEPAKTNQIIFHCLIGQPADAVWNQRPQTDLLAKNLYIRFSDFPGQTDLWPMRFQDNSPYYWPEQRIVVHTMSTNDFNRYLPKITGFLNRELQVSGRLLSEVAVEYHQLSIDSLLLDAPDWKNIAALYSGSYSISRLSLNDASGPNTSHSAEISVYLYGNFNPIELIPLLDIDIDSDSSLYVSRDFHSDTEMGQYQIIFRNQHTILHFPLPEEINMRFILSRFLTHHIRQFFRETAIADSLRFYIPWKSRNNFMRVIIPHQGKPAPWLADLQRYLHHLTFLGKPHFLQWYYTQYVDDLNRIDQDALQRLLFRHLFYWYGHDLNELFQIEKKESIDFGHIQNLLQLILGEE